MIDTDTVLILVLPQLLSELFPEYGLSIHQPNSYNYAATQKYKEKTNSRLFTHSLVWLGYVSVTYYLSPYLALFSGLLGIVSLFAQYIGIRQSAIYYSLGIIMSCGAILGVNQYKYWPMIIVNILIYYFGSLMTNDKRFYGKQEKYYLTALQVGTFAIMMELLAAHRHHNGQDYFSNVGRFFIIILGVFVLIWSMKDW